MSQLNIEARPVHEEYAARLGQAGTNRDAAGWTRSWRKSPLPAWCRVSKFVAKSHTRWRTMANRQGMTVVGPSARLHRNRARRDV
jgi:hypothetical protein